MSITTSTAELTKLSDLVIYAGVKATHDKCCTCMSSNWYVEFDRFSDSDNGPIIFCNIFNRNKQDENGDDVLFLYKQVNYNPQAADNHIEMTLLLAKILPEVCHA